MIIDMNYHQGGISSQFMAMAFSAGRAGGGGTPISPAGGTSKMTTSLAKRYAHLGRGPNRKKK